MKSVWQKLMPWLVGFVGLVVVLVLIQMLNLRQVLPTPGLMMGGRGIGAAPAMSDMMGLAGGEMAAVSNKMMIAPEPMPPYYGGGDDVTTAERSIVRTASMELSVDDATKALSETQSYVTSVGGLVTQSNLNSYKKTETASLTLRVPKSQFEAVIGWLKEHAKKITSLSMNNYDQTGQVTNAAEQLEVLKQQEADIESQLATASSSDKIRLQQQLRNVQNQIKNWEKQQQNLEGEEEMSTIYVTFTKSRFSLPVIGSLDLSYTLQSALDTLVALVQLLVTLAIWAIVFVPVWLPTVYLVRRAQKKNQAA